jgi:hypothetical protein
MRYQHPGWWSSHPSTPIHPVRLSCEADARQDEKTAEPAGAGAGQGKARVLADGACSRRALSASPRDTAAACSRPAAALAGFLGLPGPQLVGKLGVAPHRQVCSVAH